MKQVQLGTLHLAGRNNDLYGLCDHCWKILHLATMGDYPDQFKDYDPNDDYDLDEAYQFSLVGEPFTGNAADIMRWCDCEPWCDHLEYSRYTGQYAVIDNDGNIA